MSTESYDVDAYVVELRARVRELEAREQDAHVARFTRTNECPFCRRWAR